LLQRERGNAATRRSCMLDRSLEGFAHRPPERRQYPLRSVPVLPGAEGTPGPFGVERLRVVADESCRVQRSPMILAAECVAIEQPQPALLARAHEEFAALRVEGDRRGVHVEIASPEPVRIRRAEKVG